MIAHYPNFVYNISNKNCLKRPKKLARKGDYYEKCKNNIKRAV